MSSDSFFDGNAAAGELRDVFSVDITSAACQCATCGAIAPLARGHLYAFAPGIVVRCAACEQPLVRLVKGAGYAWLDLRGLVYLQLEMP
jgi:Family of unknown function (DUF6510)